VDVKGGEVVPTPFAGRGLWQKEGFDPEKCQKERFALARRSTGGPAHLVKLVF
jgi:hypothetical protein